MKKMAKILLLALFFSSFSNLTPYFYANDVGSLKSFTLFRNKMVLVANDENDIPIATFSVSCRKNNPNVGTYKINGTKQRWATLYENESHTSYVYGQYATRIEGHILFHSVCYKEYGNPYSLIASYYNDIMDKNQSLGCIRMRVGDANWVYDNVQPGMEIKVIDTKEDVSGPQYDHIPAECIMDPTDIEAYNIMMAALGQDIKKE